MSREIPYSPMHSKRKAVSYERMQEILAARTQKRAAAASCSADLEREQLFAMKLGACAAHVFDGVTDREIRKARFREAIGTSGDRIIGKRNGVPTTAAQLFHVVYGEPLAAEEVAA